MGRPRCFICFKHLMYVDGKPVSATFIDGGGNTHQVHKACLEQETRQHEADLTTKFRPKISKEDVND